MFVPLFSDTHGGHKLGLMNPEAEILDTSVNPPGIEPVPDMNSWQELMWEDYGWAIDEIKLLSQGNEIQPWHLGDLTQGTRFKSHLVTQNLTSQSMIAHANVGFMLDKFGNQVKQFGIVTGTGVHIGFEMGVPMGVKKSLENDYEKIQFRISHHALVNAGGVLLDLAHHGTADSIRKWLEGNLLRYYLNDLYFKSRMEDLAIPRVVARGHVHVRVEETITKWQNDQKQYITGLTLPSYSGLGAYARKVTRSTGQIVNGMACLVIQDRKLQEVLWFTRTRDTRTKETM